MKKLTCAEAKQIDLVDYLASLGHQPQKVRNQDYWYLSPFREEKTSSFKVNRQLNIWYDHGTGKGGNLVNFGTLYFNCTVGDLLNRLSQQQSGLAFSFHPLTISGSQHPAPVSFAGEKKDNPESKIVICDTRSLGEQPLLDYLEKRSIPPEIASRFCQEVDFLLYGKKHTVIGFPNNAGGYELRNEYFKGSSSPKDVTLQQGKRSDDLVVFEGFFSFLSFQTINRNMEAPLSNCLVLNSLSFFEKSRPLMEEYKQIHLTLDRDAAGINNTRKALEWNIGKQDKYIDRSEFYKGHKDLNDWLMLKEEITAAEYREIKAEYQPEINSLEAQLSNTPAQRSKIDDIVNKAVDNVSRLDYLFENATITEKREIVCSIYPEKLTFDGFNYRTPRLNEAVRLICSLDAAFQGIKKGHSSQFTEMSPKVTP